MHYAILDVIVIEIILEELLPIMDCKNCIAADDEGTSIEMFYGHGMERSKSAVEGYKCRMEVLRHTKGLGGGNSHIHFARMMTL